MNFVVIADSHVTTASGENVDRLARAVAWINANAAEDDLSFALVLGDVAWGDGFPAAHAALDALDVPYVPINGDNEVQAEDDIAFDEAFADIYADLAATFPGWTMDTPAWHDPVQDRDTRLHDLAFTYAGARFVGLDWASRHLGGPESELGALHDSEGGTLPFLRTQLAAAPTPPPRESVVLFSHIPMHLGGFNAADTDVLATTIAPYGDTVWADLAGHYHFDGEEQQAAGYDVIVTDATWDDEVEVRVVRGFVNEETWHWTTEIVVVE